MRSLFATPLRSGFFGRLSALPALSFQSTRHLYKKAVAPPKEYTKTEVDEKVLDMLFDYAKVPQEKVTLEANLVRDLAVNRLDRVGFYWDLHTEFDFSQLPIKTNTRELASGREAADWVAAVLEETQRLKV